jgi:hypothetical protein
MPYERQRSILKAPDRSLVRAVIRRGMGQAPCPSMQQLQGIADINDPCQNPSAGPMLPPGTTAAVTQPQWSSIVSNLFTPPGVPSSAGGTTPVSAGIPGWAIAAGVGLLAIVLIGGGGRR